MNRDTFILGTVASLGKILVFIEAESTIQNISKFEFFIRNRADIVVDVNTNKLKEADTLYRRFSQLMADGIHLYRCQPCGTKLLLSFVDDVEHDKLMKRRR